MSTRARATRGERREPVSADHEIVSFMHCARCLRELPDGTSPREHAQLEVGFTPAGLQVWCRRHEVNVVHIDFEGCRHPANCEAVAPRGGDGVTP